MGYHSWFTMLHGYISCWYSVHIQDGRLGWVSAGCKW